MTDRNAAQGATGSKSSMENLPAEVRDSIYKYLLNSNYTRLKRRSPEDPAYKFHTNILAVNCSIHREAERYLYRNNTFVSASHFTDDAYSLMSKLKLWVPLVACGYIFEWPGISRHYAASMNHYSLQVHFAHSSDRLSDINDPTIRTVPRQAEYYVFLAEDLDSFCAVLAYRTTGGSGPGFKLYGASERDCQSRGFMSSIRR